MPQLYPAMIGTISIIVHKESVVEKLSEKVFSWASDIDDLTRDQVLKTGRAAFVAGPIALMPDAHLGIGSTVGSVIPTQGAIIPAAVGVDIGCGMVAVRTSLRAGHLPDDMGKYLAQATRDIPAGIGQGHENPTDAAVAWFLDNRPPTELSDRQKSSSVLQFGSLGSGNHFYEVCLDELDNVWLVLHSGSRGIGNQLARCHIEIAKDLAKHLAVPLEDPDLAYLLEDTPEFSAYISDMLWSQRYARANRDAMMDAALRGFFRFVGAGREVNRINCHHNFTEQEWHGGKKLWITRKGAISAKLGEWGVVPGSMGTRSYIVRGLGNPLSYCSSAHGAGRRMSRGRARRELTIESFSKQMQGIVWQQENAKDLLDEAPGAYKDIDQVMDDQKDLTRIVHTLHQVFNYKGVERSRR